MIKAHIKHLLNGASVLAVVSATVRTRAEELTEAKARMHAVMYGGRTAAVS